VKHGAAAIERLCEEDPVAYIRVIASLVPKELKVERSPYADMTDEEINAAIIRQTACLLENLGSLGSDLDGSR
jgi:hypothetical protein